MGIIKSLGFEYIKNNLLMPIFFSLGILGILLFVYGIPGITYNMLIVLPAAAVFSAAVWYIHIHKKHRFYQFAVITVIICAAAAFLGRNILISELSLRSVTFLTLILTPILIIVLFFIEVLLKNILASYLLITALIISAPILGASNYAAVLIILIIFQTAFTFMEMTRNPSYKSGIITALIIAAAVLMSALTVGFNTDKLCGVIYKTEETVYQSICRVTGKQLDFVQDGKISRFNNYQTDTEQLTVQITREPTENIYLRGFVGGSYSEGTWNPSDDNTILNKIQTESEASWGILGINNMYSNMYFTMNSNTLDASIPTPTSMFISYSNLDGKNYYVPYYSRFETIYVYGGYRFQYYEQSDMRINVNNVSASFMPKANSCLLLQKEYFDKARKVYTQVPKNSLPRLTKLCAEKPLNELDDITSFILSVLKNTEYSQTPGWAVMNGDVTENFLFDKKRGYCVHYASAAALMYRLYGIPARYVTGYMIQPSEFEKQEYGTYNASVSDNHAHAWVEIFINNYGWTPIEVTPSYSKETNIYPGYKNKNYISSDINFNISGFNIGNAETGKNSTMSDTDIPKYENPNISQSTEDDSLYKYEQLINVAVTALICAVVFVFIILFIVKKRRRKLLTPNCRREFAKLIELINRNSIKCDGSEDDFAEKLNNLAKEISLDDISHMLEIVTEAAFAAESPDDNENQFAIEVCNSVIEKIRKTL